MLTLMEAQNSPIEDFFPSDFGLDLNGKRYAWQGVVLLPFIDEPRLLRIINPLSKGMEDSMNKRNVLTQNLLFGHCSDLLKKLPKKGTTGTKDLKDKHLFGGVRGQAGAGDDIESPIEGLADVEESECVSTEYDFPDRVVHSIQLLEGATFEPQIVDQHDLDDPTRLKGFGGSGARKIIMQALGIFVAGGGKKGGKFGKGKGGGKKGGKKGDGKFVKGGGKFGGGGNKGAPPMPTGSTGPRRPQGQMNPGKALNPIAGGGMTSAPPQLAGSDGPKRPPA